MFSKMGIGVSTIPFKNTTVVPPLSARSAPARTSAHVGWGRRVHLLYSHGCTSSAARGRLFIFGKCAHELQTAVLWLSGGIFPCQDTLEASCTEHTKEPPVGFEPTTSRLLSGCSAN